MNRRIDNDPMGLMKSRESIRMEEFKETEYQDKSNALNDYEWENRLGMTSHDMHMAYSNIESFIKVHSSRLTLADKTQLSGIARIARDMSIELKTVERRIANQ